MVAGAVIIIKVFQGVCTTKYVFGHAKSTVKSLKFEGSRFCSVALSLTFLHSLKLAWVS